MARRDVEPKLGYVNKEELLLAARSAGEKPCQRLASTGWRPHPVAATAAETA